MREAKKQEKERARQEAAAKKLEKALKRKINDENKQAKNVKKQKVSKVLV